ncbi:MAG TPA: cupredoxin domain-containing protein [Dehalococcoidia bacterium]
MYGGRSPFPASRSLRRAALAVLATAVLAAACGGGSETPEPAVTAAPPGSGPAAQATAAPPPEAVEVEASGTAFNVDAVTVEAGREVTVVFRNRDAVPHQLAFYRSAEGGLIAQGDVIAGGQSDRLTFEAPSQPGTYHFRCELHPAQMQGRLEVR